MALKDSDISKILIEEGYLNKKEAEYALKESERRSQNFLDILIALGYLSKDLYREALAEHYKIEPYNSNIINLDYDAFKTLEEELAIRLRTAVIKKDGMGNFLVAVEDPEDQEKITLLNEKLGNKIKLLLALPEDIDELLVRYRPTLESQIESLESSTESAVELLNILLEEAIEKRASDIHIEPLEKEIVIRFRIDGVLHVMSKLSKGFLNSLVTRIKILAHLRTDEHRSFQDGSVRFRINEISYDTRVSIAPTIRGEKVAFRILSEKIRRFTLGDLGFSEDVEAKINKLITRPFGMILTTGPTGCGKTTTLYAILRALNNPEINIMTIEDPIEYRIDGVNQIQVNQTANITFAKGLRSMVRQDPDVVLVGEIRDSETADISVNAALTGHLVLSTIHTNNAPTTLPRLIEMGVEPFLVSSTLIAAISQKLVRKLCKNCLSLKTYKKEDLIKIIGEEAAKKLGEETTIRLPYSKGCKNCANTGFKGRIGLFEILEISPKIHDLILKKAGSEEIYATAKSEGFSTMFDDGINKVQRGMTTIEEVLRVTLPEKIEKIKTLSANNIKPNTLTQPTEPIKTDKSKPKNEKPTPKTKKANNLLVEHKTKKA
ncbi:MAG: type II/IV secretion system protein [bacterium]